LLRNFRDRRSILPRPDYARAQIFRIRLSHPVLASVPVQSLNPIRSPKGIPQIQSSRETL
jgi:hypothetical protein